MGWFEWVDGFEGVFHGGVEVGVPDGFFAQAASVNLDGGVAVGEDVVVNAVVATTTDEDGEGAANKEVAEDGDAAGAVVEVDADCVGVFIAEVVDVVVLDAGATFGPVAAHVNGTCLVCFEACVVDVVVGYEVFVSGDGDGTVRGIVNVVVCDLDANA